MWRLLVVKSFTTTAAAAAAIGGTQLVHWCGGGGGGGGLEALETLKDARGIDERGQESKDNNRAHHHHGKPEMAQEPHLRKTTTATGCLSVGRTVRPVVGLQSTA